MPDNDPKPGDVYYYPYIWDRQPEGDDPEKDRPCCVTLRLPAPVGGFDTYLLALGKSGFPEGGSGILVPRQEIQRLHGLDPTIERWLTTSEFNATIHTFASFSRMEYRGSLSSEFMKNEVVPKVRHIITMSIEKKKLGK